MISRNEFRQIASNGIWKQNTSLIQILGLCPLLAVTTNLTTNFLRKPPGDRPVMARCRMLKVGRSPALGEVVLYSEGRPEDTVAHVVGTYAIPPNR